MVYILENIPSNPEAHIKQSKIGFLENINPPEMDDGGRKILYLDSYKSELIFSSPNNFRMFFVGVEFSCKDEEVVAKAIHVGDDVFIYFCSFFNEGEDASFGTSAHRAADVAEGCGTASTGENETLEWR